MLKYGIIGIGLLLFFIVYVCAKIEAENIGMFLIIWAFVALEEIILLVMAIMEKNKTGILLSCLFIALNYFVSHLAGII
jgi:hypothetical protein